MVKPKVVITEHAQERGLSRGIDSADMRRVVQESIQTVYDKERKNYKSVGNAVDSYTGQTRYLVVIHSNRLIM